MMKEFINARRNGRMSLSTAPFSSQIDVSMLQDGYVEPSTPTDTITFLLISAQRAAMM